MSVAELQKFTAISKYAKYLDDKKRREVWPETVARYTDMMVQKLPHREERIREVCRSIESFDVLPSMRGLQFGGKPIFQHAGRIYNCTSSYCDRLKFFPEAFYLLLCGSGTGFSVQQRHTQYLPKFSKKRLAGVKLPKKKFIIPDSIEGWADSSAVLLSSYHEEPIVGFEDYHDCEVAFDYTQIREEGSLLSFGVGRAPGPMPLRNSRQRNRNLLNRAIEEKLKKLNSVYAYDFAMHDADAVISGGVRRSATIVLFDLFDDLMMQAKIGNWRAKNPQRGRSNNSVVLHREETDWDKFAKIFDSTRQWGEPGFYWTSDCDIIPNPCVEIGFFCYLLFEQNDTELARILKSYQGPKVAYGNKVALSGWQCCNLTSINGKQVKDEADFYNKCEQASDLGTWQATFNHFPYLGEVTDRIVQKEALLGVSICGIMHKPELLLRPEVLQKGASLVLKKNEEESKLCGINATARATCVKPDGNLGSTLGSFSGAHPGKFKRGFRIVQVNKNEGPYQHFKSVNPAACEDSKWSANKTDDVIRFCVEYEGLMESDLTATQFLDYVKLIQQNWVVPGRVLDRCVNKAACHNVSNTVRVKESEWDSVAKHIFDNRQFYAGISFIGDYGDRDYPQAPFTSVCSREELTKFYGEEIISNNLTESLLSSYGHFSDLWDASEVSLGQHPELALTDGQKEWVCNIKLLADNYFAGDVRKATYLLKDIHNSRWYDKILNDYKPVDYSFMVEETNTVNFQREVACAGGQCEMELADDN